MTERPVRFRIGGLAGQLSEAEWPSHLPLPAAELTVIEMPNHEHKGIAVDRNNDHHHCLQGTEGYKWMLAEDGNIPTPNRGYR